MFGPERDAPPAPVCGAPEGGLLLSAGALGVVVADGLVVGVADALAEGVADAAGELPMVFEALGDGLGEVLDVLGEGLGDGLVHEEQVALVV
jgi:hypothetical protein